MSQKPKYMPLKCWYDKFATKFLVKDKLQVVAKTQNRELFIMDDNTIFIIEPVLKKNQQMHLDLFVKSHQVVRYKIEFSDYDNRQVMYSDEGSGTTILNIEIDKIKRYIIIISEVHRLPAE